MSGRRAGRKAETDRALCVAAMLKQRLPFASTGKPDHLSGPGGYR
jgi:hypothetical protein